MTGYTTPGTILVDEKTGRTVEVGETLTDFRGDTTTLRGWREGSHPGSTGRVLVDPEGYGNGSSEYFPGVFGCRVERV